MSHSTKSRNGSYLLQNQAINSRQDNQIRVNFSAHNRMFRLILNTDDSLFAEDVIFESTKRGFFKYDINHVIKGYLEGFTHFQQNIIHL